MPASSNSPGSSIFQSLLMDLLLESFSAALVKKDYVKDYGCVNRPSLAYCTAGLHAVRQNDFIANAEHPQITDHCRYQKKMEASGLLYVKSICQQFAEAVM